MNDHQPTIDEIVSKGVVLRHAEALEVPADEIFAALDRVQQAFAPVAETLAEENYVLDWGDGYAVFEVKPDDWPLVRDLITRGLEDDHTIAGVRHAVMATHAALHPHAGQGYALPIALSADRLETVLETQRRRFDGMYAYGHR